MPESHRNLESQPGSLEIAAIFVGAFVRFVVFVVQMSGVEEPNAPVAPRRPSRTSAQAQP